MDIARNTALKVLIEYEKNRVFPNLSLKKYLRDISDERDRSFISLLVYGVIEKKLLLDYYIGCFSSVKVKKINVAVINILRMGLYQIMFMTTPSSAACNTSVELAKKNGQYKSAAFINAVLRKLSDKYKTIIFPENEDTLSIKYSISKPIMDVLINGLGKDGFEDFMNCQGNDVVYISVNTCKVSEQELISILKLEGSFAKTSGYKGLLELQHSQPIESSSAFKSGLYHVVGLPSFIAAKSLSVEDNEVVFDMCAAPGGKTFSLAYMSDDKAKISAFDIHEHKITNLSKDCKRLGLKSVTPSLRDSSLFDEQLVGKADKILCDVPCSGLGMLLKKPDIKYNDIDFKSLVNLQFKILSNAGKYLKSGGRIVYSTCTVNPDENRGVIDEFLSKYPEFTVDNSVEIKNSFLGEYTFLPNVDHTDGFYIIVLKKRGTCD